MRRSIHTKFNLQSWKLSSVFKYKFYCSLYTLIYKNIYKQLILKLYNNKKKALQPMIFFKNKWITILYEQRLLFCLKIFFIHRKNKPIFRDVNLMKKPTLPSASSLSHCKKRKKITLVLKNKFNLFERILEKHLKFSTP